MAISPVTCEPSRPRSDDSRSQRFFWLGVIAFTLLALATRILYVEWMCQPIRGLTDAQAYFYTGKHLAEGIGYVGWAARLFEQAEIPTAEFPPLFPFLLAFLHLLGESSIEGQRLIVAMMGAVNVVLVSVLGRALVNARTGLVAGALAALSPALIEIDGSFMAEALYVPLVTSSYILVIRARRRQTFACWLGVGAVLGLCVLTRAEAFLFIPFLVLPLALMGAQRRRLLAIAATAVGLAAVVLPWTIRNTVVLGAFVPVSQSFKGALLGANCHATYYNPKHRGTWVYGCMADFQKNVRGLSEAEAFNRRRDAGIHYMLEHIDVLPRVVVARVLRTWGLYQPGYWYGLDEYEGRNEDFSRRTRWVCWLLLALAPPGLVLMWLRSPPNFGLTLAPIIVVTLTTVVSYGNIRFRAAAEPSLVVLAATSLTAGWARLRTRGRSSGAPRASTPVIQPPVPDRVDVEGPRFSEAFQKHHPHPPRNEVAANRLPPVLLATAT